MSTGRDRGPAIAVRGLSKAYGRTPVLRRLDLEVRWGEVMTVLGPNGSGKTTLVKVLATLTRADEGTALVGGLDASRQGQRVRRLIGVVTHDPLLYDELTGYENLRFAARMFGLDRVDARIESAAAGLGVAARLHQRTGTLSHGLRKRMSIARALLHDPPVLLMDEPESGLDPEALTMLDAIVSGKAHEGGAVLMTTHNLERALAVGHRLGILWRGAFAHHESAPAGAGAEAVRDAYMRHTGVRP